VGLKCDDVYWYNSVDLKYSKYIETHSLKWRTIEVNMINNRRRLETNQTGRHW